MRVRGAISVKVLQQVEEDSSILFWALFSLSLAGTFVRQQVFRSLQSVCLSVTQPVRSFLFSEKKKVVESVGLPQTRGV
jgi:hypothetical protein